jgi:hypothetical protein
VFSFWSNQPPVDVAQPRDGELRTVFKTLRSLSGEGATMLATGGLLVLQDGRVGDMVDGKWSFGPSRAAPRSATAFSALDAAVYGSEYQGSRITVAGVPLFGANMDALLAIRPHDDITVQFDAIHQPQLRDVTQFYADAMADRRRCVFDIQGIVGHGRIGSMELTDVTAMPSPG